MIGVCEAESERTRIIMQSCAERAVQNWNDISMAHIHSSHVVYQSAQHKTYAQIRVLANIINIALCSS